MADRGFDGDLSLLWQIEGLSYMKTYISIMADRGFYLYYGKQRVWLKTCLHYSRKRVSLIWRIVSIMVRGFALHEDFSPLWQIEGLSYMETFLHYGRQNVWVIWRLFSIMADRGFEQDEDLSLLWKTEGLTYMKTCLHYGRQRVSLIWRVSIMNRGFASWRLFSIMADRGFELYGDFSPLWQTECLSYMKTFLHHGWQRVWARWRFISIMENRRFDLYKDLSPLWQTEGWSYMKTCHHYGR